MDGHCCKISINWYGNKNDRLGVSWYTSVGSHEEMVITPFNMGITFETYDKHGETKSYYIPNYEVAENYEYFVIEPGEEESAGYGDQPFLSMPSLSNYIIDDVLNIKCTLWHNPNN